MSTASSTAQNARETVREVHNAAADAAPGIERDLQALRDDFRRLADQVADIVASTGNAAWRRAKSSMDEAVSEAQDKGREAASAVRDASDHFIEALDESIKERPYTTLAIVAGIAFLFGASWRK
jgi:ElaB/YqjD/DUF883 family membrane-anchored ribosome-binding protein